MMMLNNGCTGSGGHRLLVQSLISGNGGIGMMTSTLNRSYVSTAFNNNYYCNIQNNNNNNIQYQYTSRICKSSSESTFNNNNNSSILNRYITSSGITSNNRYYSSSTKNNKNIKQTGEEGDKLIEDYESITSDPYQEIDMDEIDVDAVDDQEFRDEYKYIKMDKMEFEKTFPVLKEDQRDRLQQLLDEKQESVDTTHIHDYQKMLAHQLYKRRDHHHLENLDKVDVRSAVPLPQQDETIHHPELSVDWTQPNREFDQYQDEEEFDLIEEPDANVDGTEGILDMTDFRPFIPSRPKERVENTFNGIAHGYSKRKDARAIAYVKEGSGDLQINGKSLSEYFGGCVAYKDTVIRPLVISETLMRWDVDIKVSGGGMKGQSEAICRALALAISNYDLGYRTSLRFSGLLKHDIRRVERKKPGLKKARKRFPLVKR